MTLLGGVDSRRSGIAKSLAEPVITMRSESTLGCGTDVPVRMLDSFLSSRPDDTFWRIAQITVGFMSLSLSM